MSESQFPELVEHPISAVAEALIQARPFGLQCEVMYSAIMWAQSNPEASVAECCAYGVNEWIK